MHKVGIVPNKFTTRGNFLKAGFEANYENAANQTQKYLEFLDRKRSHYDLWGTSFR